MLKNFREVLTGIDPAPLLAQLADPEAWRNEWSKNYLDQTSLTAASVLTAAWPIVNELVRAVSGKQLGQVVITRMRPGGRTVPHIDEWWRIRPGGRIGNHIDDGWARYQVPLAVRCRFVCGDEELWMQPGSAYWFAGHLLHSVENDSTEELIKMMVDLTVRA